MKKLTNVLEITQDCLSDLDSLNTSIYSLACSLSLFYLSSCLLNNIRQNQTLNILDFFTPFLSCSPFLLHRICTVPLLLLQAGSYDLIVARKSFSPDYCVNAQEKSLAAATADAECSLWLRHHQICEAVWNWGISKPASKVRDLSPVQGQHLTALITWCFRMISPETVEFWRALKRDFSFFPLLFTARDKGRHNCAEANLCPVPTSKHQLFNQDF